MRQKDNIFIGDCNAKQKRREQDFLDVNPHGRLLEVALPSRYFMKPTISSITFLNDRSRSSRQAPIVSGGVSGEVRLIALIH